MDQISWDAALTFKGSLRWYWEQLLQFFVMGSFGFSPSHLEASVKPVSGELMNCFYGMVNCFCRMVDQQKVIFFISSKSHCQRLHHCKSPTHYEEDLNLSKTFNEVVQL